MSSAGSSPAVSINELLQYISLKRPRGGPSRLGRASRPRGKWYNYSYPIGGNVRRPRGEVHLIIPLVRENQVVA